MKKLKTTFALVLLVFIPFAFMLWFRIQQHEDFTVSELIRYPLLFGGGSIIILYFLKRYFLQEPLKDFNSGKGKCSTDILWGLLLAGVYFLLFYTESATLSNLLERHSNFKMLELMLSMRDNPWMLVLWFGPVLWIGIALFEELIRVFLLTSLWGFSPKNLSWVFFVILLSATIMGLIHWSQGPFGIVTISIKGLVSAMFFYKIRRLWPLVIAHALYDGIQLAILLLTFPK